MSVLNFLNSVLDEVAKEKGITREELELLLPKENAPLPSLAMQEFHARRSEGAWKHREQLAHRKGLI